MWEKTSAALLLASTLAACSATLDDPGSLYVAPGKFDFLRCPDLAQRSMRASTREKELTSLMDRANQDPAGPLVNALVYSTDLNTVRAELAMLRKTAAEKKCDNLVTNIPEPSAPNKPPSSKPAH
jgi:hypothetical protein